MAQLATYVQATRWLQHKRMIADRNTGQVRRSIATFAFRPRCLLDEEFDDMAVYKTNPQTREVACWCVNCYTYSGVCLHFSNDDAMGYYAATLEWSRDEKYTFLPCPCPKCLPDIIVCKGDYDAEGRPIGVNFFLRDA